MAAPVTLQLDIAQRGVHFYSLHPSLFSAGEIIVSFGKSQGSSFQPVLGRSRGASWHDWCNFYFFPRTRIRRGRLHAKRHRDHIPAAGDAKSCLGPFSPAVKDLSRLSAPFWAAFWDYQRRYSMALVTLQRSPTPSTASASTANAETVSRETGTGKAGFNGTRGCVGGLCVCVSYRVAAYNMCSLCSLEKHQGHATAKTLTTFNVFCACSK